jgi:uncharacterized membrane protein YbhN (UPF0104 family)
MRHASRVLAGSLSLGVAAVLLIVVLPHVTGVGWDDTAERVAGIPVLQLGELLVLWAAGLWAHTWVLQGALPGLTRRRAFALNLGGSSVSNVLPFGGAAGIGLNYAMLRSWGYTRVQIAGFATVSNLVVAIVKAAIAVAGGLALLTMPAISTSVSGPFSPQTVIVTILVVAVVATFLVRRSAWWCRSGHGRVLDAVRRTRQQCVDVLRRSWRRVTFGGLAYPASQVLLLWCCLAVVGVQVTPLAVFVTFAVERLLTMVPLTPGGVGVVETAATGLLAAFGADPAAAAAGVVLFRVFSYLIEIPLGAVVAAAWFAGHRRTASQPLR